MSEFITMQGILPIALLLAGYGTGKIFERFVRRRLKTMALQTSWRIDDIFLTALGTTPTLWLVLAGFYGAVVTMPLAARLSGFLRTLLFIALVASVTTVVGRLAVAYVNLYAVRVRGVLPSTTIFSNLTRGLIYVIGCW
jgi:hypothetical protein